MTFSKSFPKTIEGSSYPRWEEIKLTEGEEKEQEILCRKNNNELMRDCIVDAQEMFVGMEGLSEHQTDIIRVAISLFEKRASHEIYWKEEKAKNKFDRI